MKQRIKNKIVKSYDAWTSAVWKCKNGEPLTKKDWQARLPYSERQIDKAFNKGRKTKKIRTNGSYTL